ncbi:MAG: hypothetical protein FJ253_01770 [Phycisphaerae bacterium]|nr:hypothetical protein [Phycisphaerae bacterium]
MPGLAFVAGASALALSCAAPPAANAAVAPRQDQGPRPHLVIAPERFREALAPYLAWRAGTPQNDGVVFASLESILGDAPPSDRDSPERLKRFLFDRWRRGALGTCLLVGDGDTIPVRFMTLDRSDAAAANWAFYPSDLYYADLAEADGEFESWNGRRDDFHDRYFGEVHGESNKSGPINADACDLDPEIAVGRWPVSNADDAAAIVRKTIEWEQSTGARFGARGGADAGHAGGEPTATNGGSAAPDTPLGGAIFAVGGWVDVRSRARAISTTLDRALVGGCLAFVHDDDASPAPDVETMKRSLARAPLLLLHSGHGQPWGWEHCLSEAVIDGANLPESLPPPILFSAGCSTAEWSALPPYTAYLDESGAEHRGTTAGERFESPPPPPGPIQPGSFDRSSFSERLVRRPRGGAIAVIGCSTGSQPCAISLLEGFVDACDELSRETATPTLGEAWRRAVRDYRRRERLDSLVPTESWYPPSIFFQGMKFVLLGDPSLRLPLQRRADPAPPAAPRSLER